MTEPTTTEPVEDVQLGEMPAATVTEALRRVMRDLPGIGYTEKADPKQGGYAYRGIKAITREVQPLLAKHGVVITPYRILDRDVVNITVNGKPWTDERMTVLYRIYGPGGPDDFIEVEAPAIGRDNSDKGSNKCMTQAFKYVLIQTLCIADERDDGDAASYATDQEAIEPPEAEQLAWRNRVERIRELTHSLRERGVEVTETSDEGEVTVLDRPVLVRGEDGLQPAMTNAQADDLIGYLVRALADTVQPAPEPPQAPEPAPAPAPPPEPSEPATAAPAPPERQPSERELQARASLDRAKAAAKPMKEVKDVQTKGDAL